MIYLLLFLFSTLQKSKNSIIVFNLKTNKAHRNNLE